MKLLNCLAAATRQIRLPLLFAAALSLLGSAPLAEACTSTKGVATPQSVRAAAKKRRIPLSSFLAGVKPNPAAAAAAAEPSITGLWSVAIMEGSDVEDLGFESFNAGGTHILNDPAPILTGNVCLGAWTQVAPLTYLINHPSYLYDEEGVSVIGLVSIYEKVVLDPGGNTFLETFHVVITDLDGKVQQTIDGMAVGKRIKGEDNPLK